MLEIKNTVTKTKNTFNGPTSRLDMAEEKISEFEDMSVEIPNMKSKEKKD